MTTGNELAHMMFRKSSATTTSGTQSTLGGNMSVRYGVVQAFEADKENGGGLATVLLDGSTEPIYALVDFTPELLDRVRVTMQNGAYSIALAKDSLKFFGKELADGYETFIQNYLEDDGSEGGLHPGYTVLKSTDVKYTSDGIFATFYNNIQSANKTAGEAKTAAEGAKLTFITQDTNGVTVYGQKSGSTSTDVYKARVAAAGSFQILNGSDSVLLGISADSSVVGITTTASVRPLSLTSYGRSDINLDTQVKVQTMYSPGMFINDDCVSAFKSGTPSSSTASTSISIDCDYPKVVEILYHCAYTSGYHSVRAALKSISSVRGGNIMYLTGIGVGNNSMNFTAEAIRVRVYNSTLYILRGGFGKTNDGVYSDSGTVVGPIRTAITGSTAGANSSPGTQFYIDEVRIYY